MAPGGSWELGADSRTIAAEMLRTPIGQLAPRDWSRTTAQDLRHFLVQQMEAHVERRLVTAPVLEAL